MRNAQIEPFSMFAYTNAKRDKWTILNSIANVWIIHLGNDMFAYFIVL